MRKPVLFGMAAVIVLLLGVTAVLYQKYQASTTSYSSLQTESDETKARYGQAINDIASIQDSLNAIVPGGSTVELVPGESPATRGDAALARIALLRAGIERTKDRIRQLDSNLRASGVKVAGLQKMLANLRTSLADKESLVAELSTRVDSLQTANTGLATEVQQSQETITTQAQNIEDKRKELGTVYYSIGSKKDLVASGVVVSSGGVLGLGKTLEPAPRFDESHFTAIDTDAQTVITIPATKARVISAQPASSYELQLVDGQMQLHILDPKMFRTVRHVVILTA